MGEVLDKNGDTFSRGLLPGINGVLMIVVLIGGDLVSGDMHLD